MAYLGVEQQNTKCFYGVNIITIKKRGDLMEFQFLKMFYDIGVFTKVQIQECLQKGLITQQQYQEIINS